MKFLIILFSCINHLFLNDIQLIYSPIIYKLFVDNFPKKCCEILSKDLYCDCFCHLYL